MGTERAIFEPGTPDRSHSDSVNMEGLEDLFGWASEFMADSNDPRRHRVKEQKVRRNVLELIQHSKEMEAREKFQDELAYLHRRVIALLQLLSDKVEENGTLKQIVLSQYLILGQALDYQLSAQKQTERVEEQRKREAEIRDLLDAVAKLKIERDHLEEVLCSTEDENDRLVKILQNTRVELEVLKNRKWWHPLASLFRVGSCSAAS